jgi:hypothetical protein
MLANLLDPRGTHGQGAVFLELFLKTFGCEAFGICDDARVALESRTEVLEGDLRRMDIEILGRDFVLAIENKLAADDQPDQIADYLRAIAQRSKRHTRLLYLTVDGRRPHVRSISAAARQSAVRSGALRLANYAEVAAWLAQCRKVCASARLGWFIDSLQLHVNTAILGKPPAGVQSMMLDTVLGLDRRRLDAALTLLQMKDELRMQLRRRLMATLRAKMPKDWMIHESLDERLTAFEFGPKSRPGWTFAVEEEARRGVNRWFYGIAYDGKASKARRVAILRAARKLDDIYGKGEESFYWPWWRWFEGEHEHEPREYDNWEASTRPWLDMANGKMATHLLAMARRLGSALDKELR